MAPVPDNPGQFQAAWSAPKTGAYLTEVTAQRADPKTGTVKELGRDVLTFQRMDGVAENFHTEQNRELLERLATQTGGQYWKPADLGKLAGAHSFFGSRRDHARDQRSVELAAGLSGVAAAAFFRMVAAPQVGNRLTLHAAALPRSLRPRRHLRPRLVAKTVVDGFVAGLHRSPDFGFSQEFAEYRAYNPGDDLRHVDWNVYARTERLYLKRYRGETNSLLTILLDASNSMQFGSHRVNKMDYARYLAASLFYLAIHGQRDAAGLITFDDEIRNYIRPSTRQGQLHRLLAGLEQAEARARTDFAKPMRYFQEFLKRRGIVLIVSDFWESPESIVRTIEPLRFHGNEVVLFHVLDPEDVRPELNGPSILVDLETKEQLEVTPDYAKKEYRDKIQAHLADLRDRTQAAGMGYCLLMTDRPLDDALREYLSLRGGRN